MIKVSVIVTIYNAGHNLKRCLESLKLQTLKEIEIIMVLDCPTDGSDVVACEYANEDSRFKIIKNKNNQHIGESRNIGIRQSKGEYITFMDHDDFCDDCMLEELYYQAIENKSDIVWSIISKYNESKKKALKVFVPIFNSSNYKDEIFDYILGCGTNNEKKRSLNQCHGVLYRKCVLDKHSVFFGDTRKYLPEDAVFNLRALCYSNKVVFLNHSYYFHTYTGNNTASSISYYDWDKWYNNFIVVQGLLKDNNLYISKEKLFLQYLVRNCNTLFAEYFSHREISILIRSLKFAKRDLMIKHAYSSYKEIANPIKFRIFNFIIRLLILH